MKYIAPDYFRDFACIKGDCRHSCCIGWEIDIDADSLAYYQSLSGHMAQRLRENIETNSEGAHFRLGAHERCPFLNKEGLCDLIIHLGEDSLCQICADHPRFRNFYADREEIGLGLCCEAAARLVLARKNPVKLEIIADDGGHEEPFENEAEILELRDDLIAIVQDRNFAMDARIEHLLDTVQLEMNEVDYSHWKKFLLGLERLDESWADALEKLDDAVEEDVSPELASAFEQLMAYLLYRHVNADDAPGGRIAYCVLIWKLVKALAREADFAQLCELCRLYSSEIEYSDENMDAIIEELQRLYPQI